MRGTAKGRMLSQTKKTEKRPLNFQENENHQQHPSLNTKTPARKRPPTSVLDRSTLDRDLRLKRPRLSSGLPLREEDGPDRPTTGQDSSRDSTDPIECWVREGRWPPEGQWPPSAMEPLIGENKSLLSRRQGEPSSTNRKQISSSPPPIPSDERSRQEKTRPYQHARYEALLAKKGSYMTKPGPGISRTSKTLCEKLLKAFQVVPVDSLFRDDLLETTCQKIQNQNEARVIQDIARLIVPSAESLATFGAENLVILTEAVNQGWNSSIPFIKPRPQPDYSVGFKDEAFTEAQLAKLSPLVGQYEAGDSSLFMGAWSMFFPFLTCETQCGTGGLDVADRQNAHSMTIAVRGVAELFRLVKREDEVNRQILGFSISHDDKAVRIYGHYPVFEKGKIAYYRYMIHGFYISAQDGKDKWTAYRFTKNVYDIWMPAHLKMICSAIDQLPRADFSVSPLAEVGHPQGLESDPPSRPDVDLVAVPVPVPAEQAGGAPSVNQRPAKKRKRRSKKK